MRDIVLVPFLIAMLIFAETVPVVAQVQCGQTFGGIDITANGKCADGSPQYYINNSIGDNMNAVYCTQMTDSSGVLSRSFSGISLGPHSSQIAGCGVSNGLTQQFTLHWTAEPPCDPPSDITMASNALEIRQLGGGWGLINHHFFKSITAEYTYRGATSTDTIPPAQTLVMLGFSANPPVVNTANYVKPYAPNYCIAPGEVYP
jgi:hypothetical protein